MTKENEGGDLPVIKARIEDFQLFKREVKALANALGKNGGGFVREDPGEAGTLLLGGLEPANVAMFHLFLKSPQISGLEMLPTGTGSIYAHFDVLSRDIAAMDCDSAEMEIFADALSQGTHKFVFSAEDGSTVTSLQDGKDAGDPRKPPKLTHSVGFSVATDRFLPALLGVIGLNKADSVSDSWTMETTEGGTVTIAAKSPSAERKRTIGRLGLEKFYFEKDLKSEEKPKPVLARYAREYIRSIVLAIKLSEGLAITYKTDFPLVLRGFIAKGAMFEYVLAPRIESD